MTERDRPAELIVRGERVMTSRGIAPATVHVRGGVIERVAAVDAPTGSAPVLEAGETTVLPGLVDTHVHVNEPGRTAWEGFETATRAAAAAGVTALMDMPLNSIPATTTLEALRQKRAAADGSCWVDVGMWGGVVPGNTGELAPMRHAGTPGFKCFLVPSGVDEFAHVTESQLREALPTLRELGAVLLVHAELPDPIERAAQGLRCNPRRYDCYLSSRPAEAEHRAVELLVKLCREYGTPMHVVHLACGDAVELLAQARAEGLPMTAETCPHYLHLPAEDIPDGATAYKCAPPIREKRHAEALWSALSDGTLDMVVTDHSPCPPELKRTEEGDFLQAWGGISSLQLGLAATWTAARERRIGLEQVVYWMSTRTAAFAGLGARKGKIEPGYDADLVLFDPDARWQVHGDLLEHRHELTPYDGCTVYGRVVRTLLRGRLVYEEGRFEGGPRGELLQISATTAPAGAG